jgi:(R)-2-hydroxyglutarate---pyruvate transhydrogenase
MGEEESPLIITGTLSQSPSQFTSLWALREGLTEAIAKEGKVYKYDISVPLGSFQEVVDTIRGRLEERGLIEDGSIKAVVGYGHVGDGKLPLDRPQRSV